jgi:muscarinic acetylcholine receptor M3
MDPDYEDTPSDMGYATPVSVETPLQSSVSRCTSLNVIRDPYTSVQQQQTPTRQHHLHHFDSRSLPASSRLAARSVSSDSVSGWSLDGHLSGRMAQWPAGWLTEQMAQ